MFHFIKTKFKKLKRFNSSNMFFKKEKTEEGPEKTQTSYRLVNQPSLNSPKITNLILHF